MSKITVFLVILLIFTGIYLRFANLTNNFQFDWDQENLVANPAWQIIVEHKYSLIGAPTSVGNLYLGPLYLYLTVPFFVIFKMDPLAAAIMAGTISTVTFGIYFFVLKKYFQLKTALFFVLFSATSAYLTFYDRVSWNVNLLPLTTLCFILGLMFFDRKKYQPGWIFSGLSLFLGINCYVTTIFFIPVIFISAFRNKAFKNIGVFWFMILVFFGLLPLIVFNFRHDQILIKNLLSFSKSQTGFSLNAFFWRLKFIISLLLETLGRLFFYNGPSWIQTFFGIITVILIWYYRKFLKNQMFSDYCLLLLSFVLGFSLYRGNIPDYYFLGIFPYTVLLIAIILSNLKRHYLISCFWVLLIIFNLYNTFSYVKNFNSEGLAVKRQIVEAIRDHAQNHPVSVNFDVEKNKDFGFYYLFRFYRINIDDKQIPENTYWISQPKDRFPYIPNAGIGNYVLGFPETSAQILKTTGMAFYNGLVKARIPKKYISFACPYQNSAVYIITPNFYSDCNNWTDDYQAWTLLDLPDNSLISTLPNQPQTPDNQLGLQYVVNETLEAIFPFSKDKSILAAKVDQARWIIVTKNNSLTDLEFNWFLNSLRR